MTISESDIHKPIENECIIKITFSKNDRISIGMLIMTETHHMLHRNTFRFVMFVKKIDVIYLR